MMVYVFMFSYIRNIENQLRQHLIYNTFSITPFPAERFFAADRRTPCLGKTVFSAPT
jgi:hypothetical protein